MNRVFLASITTKLQRHGHRIEWLLEGENIRHGRCKGCGLAIVLEGQGGFHHARGDALEQVCSAHPSAVPKSSRRVSASYAV